MQNPYKLLKKKDWIIYGTSLIVVLVSNFISKEFAFLNLISTLIGVTMLIFVAKGNVWGQILSVLFCILYAITSYKFRYYGEMITYLCMSLPIAVVSVIEWLKNPYEKGKDVVKIRKFSLKEGAFALILSIIVTIAFYFVLKVLNTPNLIVSTVSVTTSFLAAYFLLMRISIYAIAYAVNDIVLIVLWVLASIENLTYVSVVACFLMFLLNDVYSFINWKKREKQQNLK